MRQDLIYAWRQLRRAPGFAAVVVAVLALGIGGTTAVFSVVQAVLLAPLPYDEPGRLVRFYQQEPADVTTRYYLTGPHFTALRNEAASFENVAALNTYSETGFDLVIGGQAQRVRALEVTSDYFRTLKAGVLRGPGFDPGDERGTRRVVVSDALWRTRFAADPSLVGRTMLLSGESYEVAAIAAPGTDDPIVGDVDVWVPYDLAGNTSEENYSLTAVGRLRPGVTIEQARGELAALSQSMQARWPSARRSAMVVLPLGDDVVAASRGPLQLLMIAVGLVLLIVCVNVANLVLVRATGRVQEFAIRAALGSGRGRLIRQLVVESVALALLGGILGLALAWLGVDVLRDLGRDAVPRLDEVAFDPRVLGFAALVTAATAVVAGVLPALRLARVAPQDALRRQSRSATGGRAQRRVRHGLAAAQLALAVILVAGAGVLLASLYRLQQVDLGVRVDGVLTFDVNLPAVRYDAARRAAFHEIVAERLAAIPGVTAAGGVSRLPATGSYHPWGTRILTGPRAGTVVSRGTGANIQQRVISGNLFGALGLPLVAGRTFDARDDESAPPRAVVSAAFARQAFPGAADAALGQFIAPLGRRLEIVGVVGDVTLDAYGAPALVVYQAHRQFASNRNWALSQVVTSALPPEELLPAVRTAVAALDPELVVHRAAPLAAVVGRGVSRERFAVVLMGAFATVSLLLAALGLYGVLAYAVRQRAPEIGIRIALGASPGQVRVLVLRQAAVVLAAGLVVGLAGALALGRWLSSLLFQVSASDPRILAATAVLLAGTGLLAAWLPARRASRLAPRVSMHEV